MSDDQTYAGDIACTDAWEMLKDDPDAVLIDVRTDAEFAFVGVPDLTPIGKRTCFVQWKFFPTNEQNPGFAKEVAALGAGDEAPLLFLCRSGVRSRFAAEAMTALGYKRCYNVAHGFEGDKDADQHRGRVNGWKVSGLPWTQG